MHPVQREFVFYLCVFAPDVERLRPYLMYEARLEEIEEKDFTAEAKKSMAARSPDMIAAIEREGEDYLEKTKRDLKKKEIDALNKEFDEILPNRIKEKLDRAREENAKKGRKTPIQEKMEALREKSEKIFGNVLPEGDGNDAKGEGSE